jgi:hypothetical protein
MCPSEASSRLNADTTTDAERQVLTFRHSFVHRYIGFVIIFLGIGMFAAGMLLDPFEWIALPFGLFIASAGAYFVVKLSDTVRIDESGITRWRTLLGETAIGWSRVRSIRDGELAITITSSSGDELRVSRHLPEFPRALAAIKRHVQLGDFLAKSSEIAGATSFSVGWLEQLGPLVFLIPISVLGVYAWQEWDGRLLAMCGALIVALVWRVPWIRLDIESDRFVLRWILWKRTILFPDVIAVQTANTQSDEGAIIAQNLVMIVHRRGKPFYFAPRAGAIAVEQRANAALAQWREQQPTAALYTA